MTLFLTKVVMARWCLSFENQCICYIVGYVQFSGVSSINTQISMLVTNHAFFILFQRICKMFFSYFETDFMPLCITFYTDKGIIFICA